MSHKHVNKVPDFFMMKGRFKLGFHIKLCKIKDKSLLKWAWSLSFHTSRANSRYLQAPVPVPWSTCASEVYQHATTSSVSAVAEEPQLLSHHFLSFQSEAVKCALRLKACATLVLLFHALHGRLDYQHKSQKLQTMFAAWFTVLRLKIM